MKTKRPTGVAQIHGVQCHFCTSPSGTARQLLCACQELRVAAGNRLEQMEPAIVKRLWDSHGAETEQQFENEPLES